MYSLRFSLGESKSGKSFYFLQFLFNGRVLCTDFNSPLIGYLSLAYSDCLQLPGDFVDIDISA